MDEKKAAKARCSAALFCGLSTLVLFLLAAFFAKAIPHNHALMAVPEVILVIAWMPLLFMWQTFSARARSVKIAGIASATIWALGLIAGLTIKPTSVFIHIPDALLLTGFLPLLYSWRFSLPWLLFGALNLAIGFFLLLVATIDDSYFPAALLIGKHHLAQYHPPLTWMFMGLFSCIFGLVRLGKNLCLTILERRHRGIDLNNQ